MSHNKCHKFKVLFIGDTDVGKTSIIKYIDDLKNNSRKYTVLGNGCIETTVTTTIDLINVEYCFNIDNFNESVSLNVWDTAGSEKYRTLTPNFFNKTDAIVFCFDITKKLTFENLCNIWVKMCNREENTNQVDPNDVSNNTSPGYNYNRGVSKNCIYAVIGTKLDKVLSEKYFKKGTDAFTYITTDIIPSINDSEKGRKTHQRNFSNTINSTTEIPITKRRSMSTTTTTRLTTSSPSTILINSTKQKNTSQQKLSEKVVMVTKYVTTNDTKEENTHQNEKMSHYVEHVYKAHDFKDNGKTWWGTHELSHSHPQANNSSSKKSTHDTTIRPQFTRKTKAEKNQQSTYVDISLEDFNVDTLTKIYSDALQKIITGDDDIKQVFLTSSNTNTSHGIGFFFSNLALHLLKIKSNRACVAETEIINSTNSPITNFSDKCVVINKQPTENTTTNLEETKIKEPCCFN